MNHHAPLRHAESGASATAIAPARRGLTLIELLVTIVIMVTVLAGALPLLSPNNNSRKIREASRQLTTLFAQAQAQAARDGRPVGVAFRESGAPGSYTGIAVEAYMVAEPPVFAGFSEYSRVAVSNHPDGLTYGPKDASNPNGNGGTLFVAKYLRRPIQRLTFSLYQQEDPIPPRTIRNGDVLEIGGNRYLIIDDDGVANDSHQLDPDTGQLLSTHLLNAVVMNLNGQMPPQGLKSYAFRRVPVNTSEQPLQFPRGIGIDLECSGPGGPDPTLWPDDKFDDMTGAPDVVKVMFGPNGSLEEVYLNDAPLAGVERVQLMLGLNENGNGSGLERNDYDFGNNPAADAADLAARRSRVNWLNPDCRWVTISRAGRIITADNNVSYDPGSDLFLDPIRSASDFLAAQRSRQIEFARESASRMDASTGR